MSTRLTGHVITYLEAKVQLTADDIGFVMTITKDTGTAWKFNPVTDGFRACVPQLPGGFR